MLSQNNENIGLRKVVDSAQKGNNCEIGFLEITAIFAQSVEVLMHTASLNRFVVVETELYVLCYQVVLETIMNRVLIDTSSFQCLCLLLKTLWQ